VAWWLGGLVAWWLGGLVAWWLGGLVAWWLGGLVARHDQDILLSFSVTPCIFSPPFQTTASANYFPVDLNMYMSP
jgi:hypothetical protein